MKPRERFSLFPSPLGVSMQFSIYCLHDTIADHNSHPFVSSNDQSALRELKRVAAREGSDASEYELWLLGRWQPLERVLVALEQPVRVLKQATAVQV